MDYQGELINSQVIHQCFEIFDMAAKAIRVITWFIGEPATDMIQGDDPVLRPQRGNEVAKIVGPGRVPVNHNNRRSTALVNIVESTAVDGKEF